MNYYTQDENLNFIKEKISDIKVAIFKSEINSELQLPNNIIQVLKVDDDGTVWFFTSCSGDHKQTIERCFYVYLDFHRKGVEGRLQISGHANVVEDQDDDFLNISNYSKSTANRLVLIKMKIMQAEYFEAKPSPQISMMDKIKMTFQQFFFDNTQHRIYDFT